MKRRLLSLGFMLAINVPTAFACECADIPGVPVADRIKSQIEAADAVFLGKVVRFELVKDPDSFS